MRPFPVSSSAARGHGNGRIRGREDVGRGFGSRWAVTGGTVRTSDWVAFVIVLGSWYIVDLGPDR